jgi:hypothetical protein
MRSERVVRDGCCRKKPSDTVGQPPSTFEEYFFSGKFPQLFCLQRRHVEYTHVGTYEFANSIRCGLSYIVADFRQIIWRESLRSLCKHSTRAPTVLPHNVAWPFLPFWSWCGRPRSAAMICGRKRPPTLNLASMLRQMVLPDNVAPPIFPQIFLGVDPKIYGKHVFGRSRHIMRQKWPAAHTETHDICASIFSVTFPCFMAITYRNIAR